MGGAPRRRASHIERPRTTYSQRASVNARVASSRETIAAIATAPGVGAIGILRISGPAAAAIARTVVGELPRPRTAALRSFRDISGDALDQGIALWYPAPGSFTGEDLIELQGHGGPRVLDLLLQVALTLGARPARPGEFTERAFLNGKLDLSQAEAIADLIEAATTTQARLASRSLHGAFSRRIRALGDQLTRLRVLIEASLDFPDDELDGPLLDQRELQALITDTDQLIAGAQQGELVRDGLLVVIAGPPNAGKSSLMNALSGTDAAIVTDIPGTTRDLLRNEIQIDGLPLRLIDTAGLRDSTDPIETEGIRRARAQIEQADHLLLVIDDTDGSIAAEPRPNDLLGAECPAAPVTTLIRNKVDLSGRAPGLRERAGYTELSCSALTGDGIAMLQRHLKAAAGYQGPEAGEFLARRRHLDALRRCSDRLSHASIAWAASAPPELVAEDLRLAQTALGEITGEVSSDDLLGRIFSEFCIGK